MTNKEVLMKIFAEASGRDQLEVEDSFNDFLEMFPLRGNLDKEAPPGMLEKLRAELPGIRQWLIQGGIEVLSGRSRFSPKSE